MGKVYLDPKRQMAAGSGQLKNQLAAGRGQLAANKTP
jgi:hypothetical protein